MATKKEKAPKVSKRDFVVYVTGPMRAKADHNRRENIFKACRVAGRLIKMGFTVFCPHTQERYGLNVEGEKPTDAEMIEVDLKFLEMSDCVIRSAGVYTDLLKREEASKGTQIELEHAAKMEIPVVDSYGAVMEEFQEWAKQRA